MVAAGSKIDSQTNQFFDHFVLIFLKLHIYIFIMWGSATFQQVMM